MLPLIRSHRQNHGLGGLESLFVVNIHILERLVHTGQHPGNVLDVTHLLELLNLIIEILKGELVLGEFLLEFTCLLLIELLLGLLHEGNHVTHSENTVCHTLRVEGIQSLHLLTRADELYRFTGDGTYGKGCTTSCVTVQFCEYNSVKIKPFIENLGCGYGILSGHGIRNEEDFVRIYGFLESRDFIHQFLVHCQTSCRVYDYHRTALGLCLGYGPASYCNRIFHIILSINRNPHLLAQHFQLADCRRTESVTGSEHHLHSLFALEEKCQFAAEGGLTGTVQTSHQHHCRTSFKIHLGGIASHQFCKLVVDNLDYHLLRLDCRENVLSKRLGLDIVTELLGCLVVDVRIEQSPPDILKGFCNIDFGDFSFTLENLERPLKFI